MIVFLDIDSVLTTINTNKYNCDLETFNSEMLLYWLEDCPEISDKYEIVITSNRRLRFENKKDFIKSFIIQDETVEAALNLIYNKLHKDWKTPHCTLSPKNKGDEINLWLENHKIDKLDKFKYICIDDAADYYSYQPLLLIDIQSGFSFIDTLILKDILCPNKTYSGEHQIRQWMGNTEKRLKIIKKLLKIYAN